MTTQFQINDPSLESQWRAIILFGKNSATYKHRQSLVENTYGIIKPQWDFYYIIVKRTIQHAAADVGLSCTAFNLRRLFNILPKNVLKKWLETLAL